MTGFPVTVIDAGGVPVVAAGGAAPVTALVGTADFAWDEPWPAVLLRHGLSVVTGDV